MQFLDNPNRWKVVVFIGLVILVVGVGLYLFPMGGDYSIPPKKEVFEVQGLTWTSVSYYYHPFIYNEIYGDSRNARMVKKAQSVGANYLLMRAFYSGDGEGNIIGDTEKAKKRISAAIGEAHKNGLGVLLMPYIESREYWVEHSWTLDPEDWTQMVITWAEFAEANGVEMFAPGAEMNLILPEDEVGSWYKSILPKIRSVYSGQVVTAEHPHIDKWRLIDDVGGFAGYDCIGMATYPWKDYGRNEIDIRSWEDFEEDLEERLSIIDYLSDRYGTSCKLLVPLGMDYWQGEAPSAEILSVAYQKAVPLLQKHNFTGVFFFHWASERDHLGKKRTVENTIRKMWTAIKIDGE